MITRIVNLEAKNSKQDEEIAHLKNTIFNLESPLPSKLALNDDATNPSYFNKDGKFSRVFSGPPTSCQELKANYILTPMDGIYLLKNQVTHKIEAVFCVFPTSANPIPSGRVNYKQLCNLGARINYIDLVL